MERSRLEQMGDSQLKKYSKYILSIVKGERNLFDDVNDFYLFIVYSNTEGSKKIMAPLGGNMTREDIEYMFYVITNNDLNDDTEINRPRLVKSGVDFLYNERVYRTVTRSGSINSYLGSDLSSQYLETLKDEDVIDPWEWGVRDENEKDWYINSIWFET